MNEYDNIIQSYTEAGPALATSAIGADPERATRALQLSRATGVPPLAVHSDLDGFEEEHKANLTANIVRGNSQISAYIRGNALADHVSNDDYGNLDNASRAFTDSLNSHPIWGKGIPKRYIAEPLMEGLKGAIYGAAEGFTQEPFKVPENYSALSKGAYDFLGIPLRGLNAVAGGFMGGAGGLARQATLAMGGDENQATRAEREARGIIESEMGRGGSGLQHADHAIGEVVRRNEAMAVAKPWLDAGVDVPRGVHPLIDEIKVKTNDAWVDKIQTALDEAQNSLTKERDSELFRNFAQQHFEDAQMGISGDRVAALYGDKLPEPGDGLLGWVPGIAEKLEAARTFGEDVHVPLADWVTYMDPSLARELKDDIRAWPGGITKTEAMAKDFAAPAIDGALPQVRTSAALEPMFALGDRKITLDNLVSQYKDFHEFAMLDERGQKVGQITLVPDAAKKQLYVAMVGGTGLRHDVNSFGPSLIRDIKRQLKEIYPEYETITGHRVSGARLKANTWQNSEVNHPVVKLALADAFEMSKEYTDLRNILNTAPTKFGDVTADIKPTELWTKHEQAIGQAVQEEINRITGKTAEPVLASDIRYEGIDGIRGVYHKAPGEVAKILVSLRDFDATGIARHEAIHHLYREGFFKPEEWNALIEASKAEGWRERYDIDARYEHLNELGLHEEAIAEAFRDWAKTREQQPINPVTTVFQKIWDLMQRIKDRVAEILGREPTFNELFEQAYSGELAQRERGEVRPGEALAVGDGKEVLYHGTSKDKPFDKFREAPNGTWFTTNPKEASQYAVENDSMGHRYEGGKFVATNTASRVAAMTHDFKNTLEITEWPQEVLNTSNYKKAQSQWFAELRKEGYDSVRLKLEDGHSIVVSLDNSKLTSHYAPEPVKGGPKFAKGETEIETQLKAEAAGLDAKSFKKIQDLIQKRYQEDIAAAVKRAEQEQRTLQSKEWKEQAKEVRKEAEADVRARPDVQADLLIGSGELGGKKLERNRYELRSEDLSAEQKAVLPRHYYAKDGVPVDVMANLFGYSDGNHLIEALAEVNKGKEGRSAQENLKRLIDDETNRRMEAKFGKLQDNIMLDAMDQALSETNLQILAEEWQGAAMAAGVKVVDKNIAKNEALRMFEVMKLADVNVERLLGIMGKIGRDTERMLIVGKNADALVQMQRKYMTGLIAAEARKIQKEQASFERTAKQFSKREVPSMEPEYTDFVHQIMQQVGKPVRRSVQDLQESITRNGYKNLEDFVTSKQQDLRVIDAWDQLYDASWHKEYEQLTTDEFRAVHGTIKNLVHNGKEERKIYKAGEAEEFAIVKSRMLNSIQEAAHDKFAKLHKGKFEKLPEQFYVQHMQMETFLNRLDKYDPNGDWFQYVYRDLADGSAQVDIWRKHFSNKLKDIPKPENIHRTLDNPLFKDQDSGAAIPFTRKNLIAVMLNTGNATNLKKLAGGYKLKSDDVMSWIHQNATKRDWEYVQGVWDLFKEIKDKSDTMYRSLSGVAPENIEIRPVDTPHGQFKGGYYPLMRDPNQVGDAHVLRRDVLMQDNFVGALPSAGYTKGRTGAIYPLSLELDMMTNQMSQMFHDIGMRPAIINASKVFMNKEIQSAIRAHFGDAWRHELFDYLKGVANSQNYMPQNQKAVMQLVEAARQNVISTLIGFNPGTVMKHGPTALGLSVKEVGVKPFAKEFAVANSQHFLASVKSLFGINDVTSDKNWKFAIENSLELQRRDRNWEETLFGATAELQPFDKALAWRAKVMQWSSKPVALSDMMSAVPTWLAVYKEAQAAGKDHGESVSFADRAVRRAHGSTASTSRTAFQRNYNPYLTSIYNFWSDVMNRQVETVWKAGDKYNLTDGNPVSKGLATVPILMGGAFAYVIFPALVENAVSPHPHDENDSWGKKAASQLAFTLASSWVGIRDAASAFAYGRDPQFGLTGSAWQAFSGAARDMLKKEPLSKERFGRLMQDSAAFIGAMTGAFPVQIGKTGRFLYGVQTKQENPKNVWQWLVGLRFGTTDKHSQSFEDYWKGKH